jgi:hypothetical protein
MFTRRRCIEDLGQRSDIVHATSTGRTAPCTALCR